MPSPTPTDPPETFSVVDDDGIAITAFRWRPTGEQAEAAPRAAVHIAHGLGEHALRYDRLARALNDAGFVVTADDHRGHGVTSAETGGWGRLGPRGMAGTLDALHAVTRAVAHDTPEPGLPLFLLGHSWGSMLAQKFALRWADELAGLILSGTTLMEDPFLPPLDLNAPFQPAATDYDWLSRDADEVRAYVDDPMCGFPPDFPFEEMAFLLGGPTDAVPSDLPILILNGAVDPVGGAPGGDALTKAYANVGVTDVGFISYTDARHEVFNETNRDEVTADLISWLDRHLR